MKNHLIVLRALIVAGKLMRSAQTKRHIAMLLLLLGLVAILPAHAELAKRQTCTSAQARQAQEEAGQLSDWESIHRSFKRFAQCDEGAISEGYSNSVSQLLAHRWNHLDAMIRLTASDHEFEQFVIRHIDESMTEDEANSIVENARLRCPREAKQFCKSIVDY